MTLLKPDEDSPALPIRWIQSAFRPRDMVIAALAVFAAWGTMQLRMQTADDRQADDRRDIVQLQHDMKEKLDKEVYQSEQQHLQMQLNDISETVHDINKFLLENHH